MFKKKNDAFSKIESLIAEGVTIKGNIISQNSMRIDGFVDGKIELKGDLIIGEKGYVKGEVQAENALLAGKVEGSLTTRQRFQIGDTGVMMGDISCSVLSIEEGGTLHGSSKMNSNRDSSNSLLPEQFEEKTENTKTSRIFNKLTESAEK